MKIRPALVVLLVAASAGLATTPAFASGAASPVAHRSTAHRSTVLPATGPGWLVATWVPHPNSRKPSRYLELVSPEGARYVLRRLGGDFKRVVDWSGDGTRILELTPRAYGSTQVSIVDLTSGDVEHTFAVNGDEVSAAFTRPLGRAVYVSAGNLFRYSLNGALAARFPGTVPGLGPWTDSWLESPDGLYLALGTHKGIALFSNDGALLVRTAVPHATYCQPVRWWSPGEILATCIATSNPSAVRLYLVPTSGAPATQLVRLPHGSFGYTDAFQLGTQTYLQAAVSCGLPYLAKLQGTTPVSVNLHLPGGGAAVLASTATSLALLSSDGCTGQDFVSWYTPATNEVRQVLGSPLSSGYVDDVLGYPNPDATGSPASDPFQ